MQYQNYIGIDPDSRGYFCVLRSRNTLQVQRRQFKSSKKELNELLGWAKELKDCCLAIEGANGLSSPLEKVLQRRKIVFYTFKASTIAFSRKSLLGQNKNNSNDAQAVAEFAMDADSNDRLDQYKRVWFPDRELRLLTRTRTKLVKHQTADLNTLWKLLRHISADLYLSANQIQSNLFQDGKILKKEYMRKLLLQEPDPYNWQSFSEEEMLDIMGLKQNATNQDLIKKLKEMAMNADHTPDSFQLLLKVAIQRLGMFKAQIKQIEVLITRATADNKAFDVLTTYKGVGLVIASTIVAETIDIRRFTCDDSFAAYAGLCSREYSTGIKQKFIRRTSFNPRLKDAMMGATNHFIQYNPDHRISGYYANLLKKNASYPKKKAARALLRMFYKQLRRVVEQEIPEDKKEDKVAKCSRQKKGNTLSSFKRHSKYRKKKTESQENVQKVLGGT